MSNDKKKIKPNSPMNKRNRFFFFFEANHSMPVLNLHANDFKISIYLNLHLNKIWIIISGFY